jgi:thiosulfate/3-mercaptopyruvate sulfurtransferase
MDTWAPASACLKTDNELREMLEKLGFTADKEVITHCQTHHRSSRTYIVPKALGFPRIKGYPGSWSEWGNDFELPIET